MKWMRKKKKKTPRPSNLRQTWMLHFGFSRVFEGILPILKFINAPVPIVMALSRTSLSLYCGNLVYYKSLVYADRATLRTTVYDNRNRIYRAA